MTSDLQSWRPAPLLPSREIAALGLVIAGALICFIAGVALAWLSADLRAQVAVAGRMGGRLTIAVAPASQGNPLESSPAAAWRAAEILNAMVGLASVRVLEPAPGDAAIAEALGARGAPETPVRLIALTYQPQSRHPTASEILRQLRSHGLVAAADDHGLMSGPVERVLVLDAARLAGVCLVAFVALTALSAWAVDRIVTHHGGRLALLGRLGMTDSALLTQIIVPMAAAAAAIGVLGAIGGALAALSGGFRPPGLSAIVAAPRPADLPLVMLWPPLTLLAVVGTAAVTARRHLRRVIP
jgi:hypothetical protein